VEFRDPGRRREFRDDARKEAITQRRPAFQTGFDLFTEEEVAKRQQRAGRFNMPDAGLQWAAPEVPEDEEKRRARAARFGVEYEAPDGTGLMDVGEWCTLVPPYCIALYSAVIAALHLYLQHQPACNQCTVGFPGRDCLLLGRPPPHARRRPCPADLFEERKDAPA
jgi:hypothetical protein